MHNRSWLFALPPLANPPYLPLPALDSAADARAVSELKSRAHSLFNFTHPSQRDITSKLPPLYKPAFPRPTSVTVGDPNPSASYYITTETYDGDSSPSSKLQNTPFTVYTVRDAIKHRVCILFCLSPRGPAHCPAGAAPCIEPPWWETKGGRSKTVSKVNGRGEVYTVTIEGEKETKTGRLAVRMPGEHVLHFWDWRLATDFVKGTEPLYFNKKTNYMR